MLDPRTALSEDIQRRIEWQAKERRAQERSRMRFEAAVAAMQGIRANCPVELDEAGCEAVAQQAVAQGDALLKELDK